MFNIYAVGDQKMNTFAKDFYVGTTNTRSDAVCKIVKLFYCHL